MDTYEQIRKQNIEREEKEHAEEEKKKKEKIEREERDKIAREKIKEIISDYKKYEQFLKNPPKPLTDDSFWSQFETVRGKREDETDEEWNEKIGKLTDGEFALLDLRYKLAKDFKNKRLGLLRKEQQVKVLNEIKEEREQDPERQLAELTNLEDKTPKQKEWDEKDVEEYTKRMSQWEKEQREKSEE